MATHRQRGTRIDTLVVEGREFSVYIDDTLGHDKETLYSIFDEYGERFETDVPRWRRPIALDIEKKLESERWRIEREIETMQEDARFFVRMAIGSILVMAGLKLYAVIFMGASWSISW